MVLREQCVNRMEIQGVVIVDPWKTYVFQTTDELHTLTPLLILQRGQGRARFCVYRFYISVQGYS
jgi:hypothetical protein